MQVISPLVRAELGAVLVGLGETHPAPEIIKKKAAIALTRKLAFTKLTSSFSIGQVPS